jgi:hypothetical protein
MVNTRAGEMKRDLVVRTSDEVKRVGEWMEPHTWRPIPRLRYELDESLAEQPRQHTTRYLRRWGLAGEYVGRGLEVQHRAPHVVVKTAAGKMLRRSRIEASPACAWRLAGARGGRALGFVMLRLECDGQAMQRSVLSLTEGKP